MKIYLNKGKTMEDLNVTKDYDTWLAFAKKSHEELQSTSNIQSDYGTAKRLAAKCNGFMLAPTATYNGITYKAVSRVANSWDDFAHIPQDAFIYSLWFHGSYVANIKLDETTLEPVDLDKPAIMAPNHWIVRYGIPVKEEAIQPIKVPLSVVDQPLENAYITNDFNVWLSHAHENHFKKIKTIMEELTIQNSRVTKDYTNDLKFLISNANLMSEYFDYESAVILAPKFAGFLTAPVGLINGKSIEIRSYFKKTWDELSDIPPNAYLYSIKYYPIVPQHLSNDIENFKKVLNNPPLMKSALSNGEPSWIIRYGVLN